MRRLSRFGKGPLVCILCGHQDPVALVPVTVAWLRERGVPASLFQDHHVVGINHDPELTVPICRNCHAVVTEGLLQAGVSMTAELDSTIREALRLEGLAAFHDELAIALRRWASEKRKSKEPND